MRGHSTACPACGTHYHGSRDVCPFCHEHIHQVGGHKCRECGTYIPTVEQLREVERSIRAAAVAPEHAAAMRDTLMRSLDVPAIMHRLSTPAEAR